PEFVFAFAPHDHMPQLAQKLIKRKIAFTMEKPMGICSEDVTKIEKAAAEAGVFCAVPFVWRYSDFIQDFKKKVKAEDIIHVAFKFIAGPPSRYVHTSPWMLATTSASVESVRNIAISIK
ncbi:gfo/Idh/MocA family oxidoreductase, partial [Lacrimispora saccharolytica]|nr:gfo/Idh/MocA family oxidoreductase [Lacrimispora saccharolytica]